MARRLDWKPMPDDDKSIDVEIAGKLYTIPTPHGLSTTEALDLSEAMTGDDPNFIPVMRKTFTKWLGKGVIEKLPLGDFRNIALAWVALASEGEEGLGES